MLRPAGAGFLCKKQITKSPIQQITKSNISSKNFPIRFSNPISRSTFALHFFTVRIFAIYAEDENPLQRQEAFYRYWFWQG